MVIAVKHKFTSAKADGADNSIIQPSDWNDTHDITLAASSLLGRAAGTAGAVQEVTLGGGLSFSGGSLKAEVAADMATKATPVDADSVLLTDSAASNAHKKLTWANIKATLKTYFDTLYQGVDATLLKSGVSATLTKGFLHTPAQINGGSVNSGTVTLAPADGHFQGYSNAGAHTFALPVSNSPGLSMCVRITNVAGAGTVTITGATKVTGDPISVTEGKIFLLYINAFASTKHIHVTAMN